MLFLTWLACIRPSDDYDVKLYSEGTMLDDILPEPTPMGGQIEWARYRLWGYNLGHGVTSFYGDLPRADGSAFTLGYADFGYPKDAGYDRNSAFLSPGPVPGSNQNGCITRVDFAGYLNVTEYVDVGDHISLSADDGTTIRLNRDPSVHPRPAGESWYAGYGGDLRPALTGHQDLPDTWRSATTWDVSFPGGLVPDESTMGSVPYPMTPAPLTFPTELTSVAIDGQALRPPEHVWVYDETVGDWVVQDDVVRYPGPWSSSVTLTWDPAPSEEPLTVSLRYLGTEEEATCSCATDCTAGFSCVEGSCLADEGSTWIVKGELICTVADDGEWELKPAMLTTLDSLVEMDQVVGASLTVARMTQVEADVPDVLSWTGTRIPISPVRLRAIDALVTRLEAP